MTLVCCRIAQLINQLWIFIKIVRQLKGRPRLKYKVTLPLCSVSKVFMIMPKRPEYREDRTLTNTKLRSVKLLIFDLYWEVVKAFTFTVIFFLFQRKELYVVSTISWGVLHYFKLQLPSLTEKQNLFGEHEIIPCAGFFFSVMETSTFSTTLKITLRALSRKFWFPDQRIPSATNPL